VKKIEPSTGSPPFFFRVSLSIMHLLRIQVFSLIVSTALSISVILLLSETRNAYAPPHVQSTPINVVLENFAPELFDAVIRPVAFQHARETL
jgi:hypothetical protein